jgi:hypothetical protein
MNLFRYLIVIFVLSSPNITTAKPSTASSEKTEQFKCEDTPAPDPVAKVETLPFHIKLADKVTNYNQPKNARFSCQSEQFKYTAIRDGEQVQVVSTYKQNGKPHAKYLALRNSKLSGKYEKHGVLSTYWSDGKKQSVEYFCNGFAVGFHQYFDKTGKLIYVADYTHSDYELHKRASNFRALFREVYAVNNEEITRKVFSSKPIFYPSWISLGLASSIEQWTKKGDQVTARIENDSQHIVNNDFDYLPFSEVYQRHKQNLQGLRTPQSYHPEILACPWIDEAMQLGLEDKRFKLKPVAAVSEQDIAATPQARYAACLAKPNADCLFEQANESLQFTQHYDSTNEFGRATLATGYPEWTRKAMTKAVSETRGFPWFVESASLKARAELALGLNQEAQQSIETAFENAFADYGNTSSINPLILANPKPISIDRIREFYKTIESKKVLPPLAVMENAAIAQARQSNIEEAMQLADEFFPKDNPFTALQIDKAKEYENADESNRHSYLSALVALAEGQIKRGDLSAAQATLNEIETLDPSYAKSRYSSSGVAVEIASVFAKMGNSDKTMSIFKNLDSDYIISYHLEDTANIAVNLCKAGKKTEGLSFADKIHATIENHVKTKDVKSIKSPYIEANFAKIELACGDADKTKSSFKDILKRADTGATECRRDCRIEGYQEVRKIALDAGLVDLVWETKKYDTPVFSLEVALQRAKNGDANSALSRLDSLATTKLKQDKEYMFRYSLIRAHILSLLNRDSEADDEFSTARQVALNMQYTVSRGRTLLDMAQTYAELKNNERATVITNKALSNGLGWYPRGISYDPYAIVISLLAELGFDQQAESVALALLDSSRLDYASRRKEQELGRARILSEVALKRFQKDQDTDSLADLATVKPLAERLGFWLKALNLAEQQKNDDALNFISDALAKELDNLSSSLDVGMDFPEKRQVIHSVAKILRANSARLTPEKQLQTLEQLNQQARLLSEYKEGAKALCELGYTAQKINQPVLSKTLFNLGTASATKLRDYEPDALGVCAFWLKTAGNTNQANALIDVLQKETYQNSKSSGDGAVSTLVKIASAYAESEKGEVQWLDGSRLEP